MELLILSTMTGITTMVGVILALLYGQPSKKILAFYLGLSAGIMSLIIVMDLLPAAFSKGPVQAVGIGLGLGLIMMMVIYECFQRLMGDRPISLTPKKNEYWRMGIFMALAIAAHNVPEGIAIGAGFESHHELGIMVAFSIALHNIPEGLGMAIPLVLSGMKRIWILLISLVVSLCIPIGALVGKSFFVGSSFMVSIGMAFAAGAMGFIVYKEIAPTSMKHHHLMAQFGMALSLVLIYLIHILG